MTAPGLALVAAAGLVGGFVNAIAGGGSLLLYPALVASGLSTVSANVTNSLSLWPGYLGNVLALGRGDFVLRRRRTLFALAAAGSAGGCGLLLVTPASAFAAVVPFLVLGASALLGVQPALKRWLARHPTAEHVWQLRAGTFVGGVYGGYFGGGLGVILMALLGLTLTAPIGEVNVLKGLLQLVMATVTVLIFGVFGPVDWVDVLLVAPLSLIGGALGGRLARRLSEPVLRWAVVAFGTLVGIWLAIRAFA